MANESCERKQPLFEATDWAIIYGAKAGDLEARRKLWETYSHVATVLLVCRGIPPQEREDVLHEFFCHFFGGVVEKADKNKGTFRCWFRAILSHFLSSGYRKETAEKRGGGCVVVSISDQGAEEDDLEIPAGQSGPDKSFDQAFAVALFSRVHAKLMHQWEKSGKGAEFESLWKGLFAAWGNHARSTGGGKRQAGALRTRLHRLRQQLVKLGIEEVSVGALSKQEGEAEFYYLLKLWGEKECALEKVETV